jgi:chromosome partitioning protein
MLARPTSFDQRLVRPTSKPSAAPGPLTDKSAPGLHSLVGMPIVAIVNQKGGVGKTSVTLGLASAARAADRRTLVIDLDPQGAAGWVLGVEPGDAGLTTADLLGPGRLVSARRAVRPSGWGGSVDVIPSARPLQDLEVGTDRDASRLARSIGQLGDDYDLVLIDCAPSLGNLTVNALTAASHAVIVTEPSSLGLRGIAAVADTIDSVWERSNPQLDLAGVIVNRVPAVSGEADRRSEELARTVGKRAVWQPAIPQRVIVSEALGERRPIHSYGSRAGDLIDVFDQLYARLRRITRR